MPNDKKWKWLTGLSIGIIALLTTLLVTVIILKISKVNDPILIQNTISIVASLMSIALPFVAIIYLRFNVLSGIHLYKISD
ncbi:MAG: hypothetical protein CVU90_00750 [Firmicutes bacterium HGW-Firmicutes-15]|nr:MAG: hypothetical protein CVU90_00750 [Firmicutes bacterium HGW-Firmicutes-15]